jgi:hypothetical protein
MTAHDRGWIGVDFDGTLAEHYWPEHGPYHHERTGKPIPKMLERVKAWLADHEEVRIFTARVGPQPDPQMIDQARGAIEAWCLAYLGQRLPVTATKDYRMRELWDDRAVQVVSGTGERADGQE